MRTLAGLAFLLCVSAAFAQDSQPLVVKSVEFSQPRVIPPRHWVQLTDAALDSIERDNPEHYAAITEVLRVAQMEPCATLPQVLKAKANLAADTLRCEANLLLASYPAKRHITFRLGNTDYHTNVVQLRLGSGALTPAR